MKGKFESSKRKSELDEEKIQAAEQVLKKYKPMVEELSGAAWDIISGTTMRPIHTKLEKIQAKYEAKMNALGNVKKVSEALNLNIEGKITQEKGKIEEFEQKQDKDIRSEDLENTVFRRNFKTLSRTMFGSVSARVAKMPYTLAARYQALKGDDKKREELLATAGAIVKDILDDVEAKNIQSMQKTQERIDKFNEVDTKTTHYSMREKKVAAVNTMTSQFLDKNKKGAVRRNISIGLAAIGDGRRFRGNIAAQVIEDVGNFAARKAALLGLDTVADKVAEQTVKKSDKIIRNVGKKNKALYNELNRRTQGYDNAAKVTRSTKQNLDGKQNRARANANNWEKNQKSTGFTTKVGMKGIKLANRAVTASTKLVGKGEMAVTEMYAKTASVIGFDKHGKTVMANAQSRNEARMDQAENFNKGLRKTTDRVFAFKDRRKQNIKDVGKFFGELGKDVAESLGDFTSDIEAKRTQQQAKRKFKAADRRVGNLELVTKGAQKVIDLISPSLNDARTEMAAAQAELNLNPERSKKTKHIKEEDMGR